MPSPYIDPVLRPCRFGWECLCRVESKYGVRRIYCTKGKGRMPAIPIIQLIIKFASLKLVIN